MEDVVSVKRLPSPWVYAACVFCSCGKMCCEWPAEFSGNALLEALDSCFLANFLFTVQTTLLAMTPVCYTNTGWPF